MHLNTVALPGCQPMEREGTPADAVPTANGKRSKRRASGLPLGSLLKPRS